MSNHNFGTDDWAPHSEFDDDGLGYFDDSDFDYSLDNELDHLDPISALEMGDRLWEASAAADKPNYSDS